MVMRKIFIVLFLMIAVGSFAVDLDNYDFGGWDQNPQEFRIAVLQGMIVGLDIIREYSGVEELVIDQHWSNYSGDELIYAFASYPLVLEWNTIETFYNFIDYGEKQTPNRSYAYYWHLVMAYDLLPVMNEPWTCDNSVFMNFGLVTMEDTMAEVDGFDFFSLRDNLVLQRAMIAGVFFSLGHANDLAEEYELDTNFFEMFEGYSNITLAEEVSEFYRQGYNRNMMLYEAILEIVD